MVWSRIAHTDAAAGPESGAAPTARSVPMTVQVETAGRPDSAEPAARDCAGMAQAALAAPPESATEPCTSACAGIVHVAIAAGPASPPDARSVCAGTAQVAEAALPLMVAV